MEKEAVKTKDPVVTTELSFSGRYAVLLPTGCPGRLIFSGKLDNSCRKILKGFLEREEIKNVLERSSLIIRTNASELTEGEPLVQDILRLASLAGQILSLSLIHILPVSKSICNFQGSFMPGSPSIGFT